MESMPVILLFWMTTFKDCDVKELKKIDYEYKIFLDEDDDFTWEDCCRKCEDWGCNGCCEEKE